MNGINFTEKELLLIREAINYYLEEAETNADWVKKDMNQLDDKITEFLKLS
jgi:hypothetical protein